MEGDHLKVSRTIELRTTCPYISPAYRKRHTSGQHLVALTSGMTYSGPKQVAAVPDRRSLPVWHWSSVWAAAAALALGVTLADCSGGSTSSAVPTTGSPPATTAAQAARSGLSGQTLFAKAEAYSRCMRRHGVPNFPDPVLTPGGGYGYRTTGIDPNSAAFQGALQACKALPSPWQSTGQQLSAAQQQGWLSWAKCIRAHGVPTFRDPTFSGDAVQISSPGRSRSPQLQSAMDACKAQMPSTGALAGDPGVSG